MGVFDIVYDEPVSSSEYLHGPHQPALPDSRRQRQEEVRRPSLRHASRAAWTMSCYCDERSSRMQWRVPPGGAGRETGDWVEAVNFPRG